MVTDDCIFVVRYTGPFGFIKPWTAVRDEKTYSQQFLTPSIIEGMRQKLEVSAILRHRLSHSGFALQQETVQAPAYKKRRDGIAFRNTSIIERGVLLDPVLHLAFRTRADAERAAVQHLCLCRNEDIVLPGPGLEPPLFSVTPDEWEDITGFELIFGQADGAFLVGYNRFADGEPMYGQLIAVGNPSVPPAVEV